ncbi:UNVERIFIED_CONTAM: hypothetical protein FOS07_30975 [Bacillus mycoides]
MSRTYRRKNGWDIPTYEFIYNEDFGFFQKRYFDKSSKEYLFAKNKYHRDSTTNYGCVPHWFVNLNSERPLRRKTKNALKKWMLNSDSELMIPLYIKDVGWYFW